MKLEQHSDSYQFRCASISQENLHHIIEVSCDGRHVLCSCAGTPWCSHIDATLNHGETAMIPPEDRDIAEMARKAVAPFIKPHPGWKAHWKNHRQWRGLRVARSKMEALSKELQMPLLSMEGRGRMRELMEALSCHHGWLITNQPSKGCALHIAPDETESAASRKAQALGLPIFTYSQWQAQASEITRILMMRIHDLAALNAA